MAQRGGRGIALLFQDLGARRGVSGQQHAPATGKDPVPTVQEAEWALGPVWTGGKISSPPGFDPRAVQPAVNTTVALKYIQKFLLTINYLITLASLRTDLGTGRYSVR